jgi:hypothetical protein
MNRSFLIALCALCAVYTSSAWPQGQLGEIVVTGSRVSGDDYSGIPAITLERRADFLVQQIRLTNDTRAADARRKELYQTIRDLLADATKKPGMALGYGDEFLIPITSENYEIPLQSVGQRPDTSSTELYVKVALGSNDDVSKALSALSAFISKARVTGRTEIQPQEDVALSIVNPERYRFEIITQISADAKKLQNAVGSQCRVGISGLSNRVSWQRSDISQLTLYIPYEIQLTDCQ